MAAKRGIGAEAEVNGHIGVTFIDPEILVRIQRVVQEVLKLVGENGFAPTQGNVGEIHEHGFP